MFDTIYLLSSCTECSLEIIPIICIAWLLGWLFWWVYSRDNIKIDQGKSQQQLKAWQTKATNLEEQLNKVNFDWESVNTELHSLRKNYQELEARYQALETFKGVSAKTIYEPVPPPSSLINEMEEEDKADKRFIYFSADKSSGQRKDRKIFKAKSASKKEASYASFFSPNDLTIVEGIGQKLEQLLKDNGISTWTRLAVTSVEDLKNILSEAGPKFNVHDPSTWPQQASLARVGQWMELILFQKRISAANKSKVKELYKNAGISAYRIDDLKIIEGIGPKVEQLLKDGGIDNWSKLASATKEDIQQILKAAGERYRLADPETWSHQADLANNGEWDSLKMYQAQLKGGKELK